MPTQQLGHQETNIYENPKNIPGFFTPTCALAHCRKRRSIDNDLRTYRYPRSEELLEKWRVNLRLAPDQCRGRICADHFEPMVRGKLKLKTGAVPTLNLGHDEGIVFDNEAIKVGLQQEEEPDGEEAANSLDLLDKLKNEPQEEDQHMANDERAEEPDEEEEQQDQDEEGDEQQDQGYFDPLELVETFAEQHSEDEQLYNDEDDDVDDNEEEEEEDIPGNDDELLLPDTLPIQLALPPRREKREKAVNNVTPICCLKHCRKERTATHQLSTFGFPKDQQQLLKWSANLQLDLSDCVGRVCIEHFEAEMLGTRKLKQNAVPTLNLGHATPLSYRCNGQAVGIVDAQPQQHSVFRLWSLKHCRKRKSLLTPTTTTSTNLAATTAKRSCCLPSCGKQAELHGVQLRRMPRERLLLRKWLHNLKLPAHLNISQAYVCEEHFEEQAMLPTLQLGHTDSNIYRSSSSSSTAANGCLVPSCPCARLNLYRGYALPEHPQVQEAWLQWLQLPPRSPNLSSHAQLCVMHYMQLFEQVPLPEKLPEMVLCELRETYEHIASSTMAMALRCAVPGCQTKYTDNVRLTKLPMCQRTRAQWLHNTKIDYDPERDYLYRICMRHFEPHCLGSVRPKQWAVPTLHLNHNDPDIYQNPKLEDNTVGIAIQQGVPLEMPLRIKTELPLFLSLSPTASPSASLSPRGKIRTCCISSCGQQANALTRLFRFPSSETALLKWLVNTQQQPRFVDAQHLFVCQEHFEPEAICKKLLRSWAVPTLKLGHDGHIIPNARHNGNIADSQENKQALQYIWANYCSVLTCFQKRSEQLRLFAYPTDRPTIRRWAANCKHRSMQASSDGFQVTADLSIYI